MDIDILYEHYRCSGFPYYSTASSYRNHLYSRYCNYCHYDSDNLIFYYQGNTYIRRSNEGLSLLHSYLPQYFHYSLPGYLSPYDLYADKDMFMDLLYRAINITSRRKRKLNDSEIRSLMAIYPKVRACPQYSPILFYVVLKKYVRRYSFVLDLQADLGAKLLPCLCLGCNYEGIVFNKENIASLQSLIDCFGNKNNLYDCNVDRDRLLKHPTRYDVVISTPLYYQYQNNRHLPKRINYNQYLHAIEQDIASAYSLLSVYGKLIIWIRKDRDRKHFSCIESIAKSFGFIKVDILYAQTGGSYKKINLHKNYDPIYIFKKGRTY